LKRWGSYQFEQCISKEPRILSIVKPPFQFIQVGVQMLDREFVIGAGGGVVQ